MNAHEDFEKITAATTKRPFYNYPPKELSKKDSTPHFYSLNTIREILMQNDGYSDRLTDKIIKEKSVIEAEEYMKSGKKINSDDFMYQSDNIFNQENFINWEYEEVKEKNNYLKIKRGRKTERNDGGEHNRYDADNIMKKIKAKVIDYCIKFINSMIFKRTNNSFIVSNSCISFFSHINIGGNDNSLGSNRIKLFF